MSFPPDLSDAAVESDRSSTLDNITRMSRDPADAVNLPAGGRGLWLPTHYVSARGKAEDPRLSMIGVFVGHEVCLGRRLSGSELADRLADCDPLSVIDLVTRASIVLSSARSQINVAVQRALTRCFWDENRASTILAAAREHGKGNNHPDLPLLFHERALLNAIKLACLVGRPGGRHVSPDVCGEVLLGLNDLLDETAGELDPAIPAHRSKLELYFYANMNTSSHGTPKDMIGRAAALYWSAQTNTALGFDFPRALEQATSVQARTFLALSLALHANFFTIGPDQIPGDGHRVSLRSILDSPIRARKKEIAQTVSAYAQSIESLAAECRKHNYSVDNLRPFHLLPLQRRPLIVNHDAVWCPSTNLLLDAITTGMGHRLLDESKFPTEERNRYLVYKGEAFDAYATALLKRTFPRIRILDATELKGRGNGLPTCDAVVLYEDAILLFEWKATGVRHGARTGESEADLELAISRCIDEGLVQLESTARLIEQGVYLDLGADPARIVATYPLLVSLDLSLHPTGMNLVWDRAGHKRLSSRRGMRALQLLDVVDLELMENAVRGGLHFREVLQAKLRSESTASLPLRNYFAVAGLRVPARDPDFLQGQAEHVYEQAKLIIRKPSPLRKSKRPTR